MNREHWVRWFLEELRAPVTGRNRMTMVCWIQSEGSPFDWNPLATTLRMPGSVTMNSHGVQAYPSFDTGLDASIRTINEPQYERIVRRLRRNAWPSRTHRAIAKSPWGTDGDLLGRVLSSAKDGHYDDYAKQTIPS